MKNTRMSLADFKVSKLDSKTEIDKLMGGQAYDCHLCQSTLGAEILMPDNSSTPLTM